MELNNYENKRFISHQSGRLGARFTSEKGKTTYIIVAAVTACLALWGVVPPQIEMV